MISLEQARSATLDFIRKLSVNDFTPPDLGPAKHDGTAEELAVHDALHARFKEVCPEFDQHLETVRPDLMSKLGDPEPFRAWVATMSPFELVYAYSRLTEGGLDDLEFIKVVHKHMGLKVSAVYGDYKVSIASYTSGHVAVD